MMLLFPIFDLDMETNSMKKIFLFSFAQWNKYLYCILCNVIDIECHEKCCRSAMHVQLLYKDQFTNTGKSLASEEAS